VIPTNFLSLKKMREFKMSKELLEYLALLELGSFEGWTEEAKKGYLTCLVSVREKIKELEVDSREKFEDCPDCKKHTVKGKGIYEGGGVVCINPDCNYWFCY